MKWLDAFYGCTEKDRKLVVQSTIDALKDIKTPFESAPFDFMGYIDSHRSELTGVSYFIGIVPLKGTAELQFHFSMPSLLYYVKGAPFALLANPALLKDMDEGADEVELSGKRGLTEWVKFFLRCSQTDRKQLILDELEDIRVFKKGERSEEGDKIVQFLMSKQLDFLGFAHSLHYVKVSSPYQEELDVEWKHDFSLPTLAFHIKNSPFLLLTNANLDYNKSRLQENPANQDNPDIQNLRGWQG